MSQRLELEPTNPGYINDTAVMLQYHFRSDENLARALSMYEQAVKLATEPTRMHKKASAVRQTGGIDSDSASKIWSDNGAFFFDAVPRLALATIFAST